MHARGIAAAVLIAGNMLLLILGLHKVSQEIELRKVAQAKVSELTSAILLCVNGSRKEPGIFRLELGPDTVEISCRRTYFFSQEGV